ncbi:MAG: hypothetical protein ACTSWE_08685 [Promethearchaeota archaeon]
MGDHHVYNFFGQKTALFFDSAKNTLPYVFFRMIRKKESGTWEKPSQQEGIVVRLSLEEQAQILSVLEERLTEWKGYHQYKEKGTPIHVYKKKSEKSGNDIVMIQVGPYKKLLSHPEITILSILMNHVFQEKIESATTFHGSKKKNSLFSQNHSNKGKSQRLMEKTNNPNYQTHHPIKKENLNSPKNEKINQVPSKNKTNILMETSTHVILKLNTGEIIKLPKNKTNS